MHAILLGGARCTAIGLLAMAATACSGTTTPPASSPSTAAAPTAPRAPTASPSPIQSTALASTAPSQPASPSPSGPARLPVLHDGSPRSIEAGDYVTDGDLGFYPGLKLSVPGGWKATEADSGEVSLHPDDRPDDSLLLWKDLVAVEPNNRGGNVGQPLTGVGRTERALVKWLTSTKDFEIVEKPRSMTLGHGIKGTQLTVTPSKTANFADPGCPDNPRCAALFKDPLHWQDDFYAIGNGLSRIFITTVPTTSGNHTFFVTLDALNRDDLDQLATEAGPVIDSLELPTTFVDN
jgi:hypothetical protein